MQVPYRRALAIHLKLFTEKLSVFLCLLFALCQYFMTEPWFTQTVFPRKNQTDSNLNFYALIVAGGTEFFQLGLLIIMKYKCLCVISLGKFVLVYNCDLDKHQTTFYGSLMISAENICNSKVFPNLFVKLYFFNTKYILYRINCVTHLYITKL